jgi:hypothetical protein
MDLSSHFADLEDEDDEEEEIFMFFVALYNTILSEGVPTKLEMLQFQKSIALGIFYTELVMIEVSYSYVE